MKILLNILVAIVSAALGAGAVIYFYNTPSQNAANLNTQIDNAIKNYTYKHSSELLESIVKNEKFEEVMRDYSVMSSDDFNNKLTIALDNNPTLLENYIKRNANFIANILLETNEFKNIKVDSNVENVEENSSQESEDVSSNNIYLEHWDELVNNDISPSIGPKDAKVTVIEFFDFACGHCKALAPIVSQLIKNNSDVRFIFNPLYFISEHSPYAAKVSLAAYKKGKFREVFDGIMTLPNMNEDTINQILVDEGLDVQEIKTVIEEKQIRRGIQDIDALSQVLGINGVPMLLINGQPSYGRNVEEIQKAINSFK